MSRKYRNPPIIEALCEFRFEQDSEWDPTVYGLMYEKTKDDFPKRKKARQLSLGLAAESDGMRQRVQASDRMQFLSSDEKTLVQVAENLLVVNKMAPYGSWEELVPTVMHCFDVYSEVATPTKVGRIGLRYINRLDLPGPRADLEEFVEFRPHLGSALPQDHGPFSVSVMLPYHQERDVLKLEFSSCEASSPAVLSATLDLDYFLAEAMDVDGQSVRNWLDAAHSQVERIFEACITDRLREVFDEGT